MSIEVKKVLSVKRYRCGYEVRREIWDNGCGEPTEIEAAYNMNGEWIGSPKDAHRLVRQRGIQPMKSKPEHCVCSIGLQDRSLSGYCNACDAWLGVSCPNCEKLEAQLAEAREALEKIASGKFTKSHDLLGATWVELAMVEIARAALKESEQDSKGGRG